MRVSGKWSRQVDSSSISIRLASVHFPLSAEFIAPCYERISNPESLEVILETWSCDIGLQEPQVPREVAIFRAITASVAISIASRLAERDFKVRRHCTCLDLAGGSWLSTICPMFDDPFSARLDLSRAVLILAAVHAGCSSSFSSHPDMKEALIGWRNGIYSVLSAVILDMTPDPEALGLRCFDGFWANVAARKTGVIVSGPDRTLYICNTIAPRNETSENLLQSLVGPYIGSLAHGPPDTPLYLNIERSLNYDEPEMCFCDRIGGISIGTVGVKEVMQTLALSFEVLGECPGHQNPGAVVNTASLWAAKRIYKPVGIFGKFHTFVPVQNDPCWTIFWQVSRVILMGELCTVVSIIPLKI